MARDFIELAKPDADVTNPRVAMAAKMLNTLLRQSTIVELLRYKANLPDTAVVRAVAAVQICALARKSCGKAIADAWPKSVAEMEAIYNSTELPNNEFPELGAAHDHF